MALPVLPKGTQQQPRRRQGTNYRNLRRIALLVCGTLFMLGIVYGIMVFSLFSKKKGLATNAAAAAFSTPTASADMEDRLRGALWSFFAGDALAAPTHWYYGGIRQIVGHYGHEIRDYERPKYHLQGSILNKSNLNGGGRATGSGDMKGKTIIGDIINHGKKELWDPKEQIHYHATLEQGENTLEVQLARVLMKSIVASDGKFDADHFRQAYVDFMTTPGSHNDTYASTCHRMFFANLMFRKLDPIKCPDNDSHNVDTIDGIVLPTIAAMATAADLQSSMEDIASASAQCASVTRKSKQLEQVSGVWGQYIATAIRESDDLFVANALEDASRRLTNSRTSARGADQMTACYLGSSLPALLSSIAKHGPENDVWNALLVNANVGGENVHRGSVLGAALGGRVGNSHLPERLREGLYQHEQLSKEIDAFVSSVTKQKIDASTAET